MKIKKIIDRYYILIESLYIAGKRKRFSIYVLYSILLKNIYLELCIYIPSVQNLLHG